MKEVFLLILFVSNNTDILQFYPEWFINRIKDKQFAIEKQKTNVVYEISPKTVDLIMFETKNPAPFLPYTEEYLKYGFKSHFLISVSPYGKDIERNVDKSKIFESIKKISALFGKENVTWVYSPVVINSTYTEECHQKYFEIIAKKLSPYVNNVVVDFIKPYKPPIHASLYAPELESKQKKKILIELHKIAVKYNLKLYADGCKSSKKVFLNDIIENSTGKTLNSSEQIIDMGLINTCKGNCEYCNCGGNLYWERNTNNVITSPLFIGELNKMKKHIKKKVPVLEPIQD